MAPFARIVVVIGILSSCQTLFGQLPTAQLDRISPAGGKVGSEFEVVLSGKELDDSNQLLFNHPGITARPKLSEPDELDPAARPIPRQFIVQIASDVTPGVYEVRANGPLGVTNPRAFVVAGLETIPKSGNPRTLDAAMELPLGVAVTGNVEASAVDYYKFSATQSQRLLIECYGQRIDSRIDATLVLYDAAGKLIKQVRDVAQLDPIMQFVVPADGDYIVGVYDFEYNGGTDYFYRLAVHEGPYVSFVYPPAALPGHRGEWTVYGYNLPKATPDEDQRIAENAVETVSVNIAIGEPGAEPDFDASLLESPEASPIARELFRLDTPLGPANPVPIGYAAAPIVVEPENNPQQNAVQKLDPPFEYVGRFYPQGDRDVIEFDGKGGEVYWIELLSSRLGVPTDAHMLIEKIATDAEGQEQVTLVAEIDDAGQTLDPNSHHVYFDFNRTDPRYKLAVDADATYRITISDLFDNPNDDPRYVYRLRVLDERPDFDLLAYAAPITGNKSQVAPAATLLPRGGNTTLAVRITRHHGFEGDVEVFAEGLPEGVVCHGAVASGTTDQVALVFSASENAAAWTGPVRVVGRATIGDGEVTRQARSGAFIWGTQNAAQQPPVVRLVSNVTLAVLDRQTAPLTVQLGDGTALVTSRGGKLAIPISATRGEDVPDDLKMKMVGVAGVNLPETTVSGNQGSYPLEVTTPNFPLGTHTVLLTGTAKYKYPGDSEAIKEAEQETERLAELVKQFAELEKQAQEDLRQSQQAAANNTQDPTLVEQVTQAQEAAARRSDLSKRAVQRKQQADKNLNDLKNANKPRDINIPFVSTPVQLQVLASPVSLRLDAPPSATPGTPLEVAVTVERKFDFDEHVDITVEMPSGVTGIAAKPLNIEKSKVDGKLEMTLAPDATPGTHVFLIRTKLKFNNVDIETKDELTLTINNVEPTTSN